MLYVSYNKLKTISIRYVIFISNNPIRQVQLIQHNLQYLYNTELINLIFSTFNDVYSHAQYDK